MEVRSLPDPQEVQNDVLHYKVTTNLGDFIHLAMNRGHIRTVEVRGDFARLFYQVSCAWNVDGFGTQD